MAQEYDVYTRRISVQITEEHHRMATKIAEERHDTVANVLRDILSVAISEKCIDLTLDDEAIINERVRMHIQKRIAEREARNGTAR